MEKQRIGNTKELSEEERIKETVQRIASTFEKGIAEHLEDWHMLQRIWIDEGIYS